MAEVIRMEDFRKKKFPGHCVNNQASLVSENKTPLSEAAVQEKPSDKIHGFTLEQMGLTEEKYSRNDVTIMLRKDREVIEQYDAQKGQLPGYTKDDIIMILQRIVILEAMNNVVASDKEARETEIPSRNFNVVKLDRMGINQPISVRTARVMFEGDTNQIKNYDRRGTSVLDDFDLETVKNRAVALEAMLKVIVEE